MNSFREQLIITGRIAGHLILDAIICIIWSITAFCVNWAESLVTAHMGTRDIYAAIASHLFNEATLILVLIYLVADIFRTAQKHLLK
jgi:hypothetical protein